MNPDAEPYDNENVPLEAISAASKAASERQGMGALHVGLHVLLTLLNEGHVVLPVETLGQVDVDLILAALNSIKDAEQRKVAKQEFANAFGKPDQLPPDRLPAVWAWLANVLDVEAHEYVQDQHDDVVTTACLTCGLPPAAGWHVPPTAPPEAPQPPEAHSGAAAPAEALSEDMTAEPRPPDPRIAEIAKALDAWEFDSFGNSREEHWQAAAEIALRIADAAYEQVGLLGPDGSGFTLLRAGYQDQLQRDGWKPVYVRQT